MKEAIELIKSKADIAAVSSANQAVIGLVINSGNAGYNACNKWLEDILKKINT